MDRFSPVAGTRSHCADKSSLRSLRTVGKPKALLKPYTVADVLQRCSFASDSPSRRERSGCCGTAQASGSALPRLRVAFARVKESLALSVCNAASDIALDDWEDGGYSLVTEAAHSFRPAAVRPTVIEQLVPQSQESPPARAIKWPQHRGRLLHQQLS
jgi:hypothetical protein